MRSRDENKAEAIRSKAIETVVKSGFDGLSMQKLAKEAGVSPATIYIYFKDRDDLIMQLCMYAGKKMIAATLKGFDPKMHFDEGLRIQWQNRAQFCIENPLLMAFLDQVKNSHLHEKTYKMDSGFIETMKNFAHNAIARKELRPLPVEIYWAVAYAPLYQLIRNHMSQHGFPGRGKFILDAAKLEEALQLVLKALKP